MLNLFFFRFYHIFILFVIRVDRKTLIIEQSFQSIYSDPALFYFFLLKTFRPKAVNVIEFVPLCLVRNFGLYANCSLQLLYN